MHTPRTPPLPTPSTSHIPSSVYPPSEDSYLLLDTISAPTETSFLSIRFPRSAPSPLLVELGTGSGIVLAFILANAETIWGRSDILGLGIDVNHHACKATEGTAREAIADISHEGGRAGEVPAHDTARMLGALQGDLGAVVRDGEVDLLVFNPPYVPTETLPSIHLRQSTDEDGIYNARDRAFKEESYLLELAYAGGDMGMETTERFLADVPRVLSKRGVFYLLLCAANKPQNVKEKIEGWGHGWKVELAGGSGKTAGWEKLVVLRGWRDLGSSQ